MQDIKRPYQNLRSRDRVPILKAHEREIYRKVEEFENENYSDDIEEDNIRSFFRKKNKTDSNFKKIRIKKSTLYFILFVFLFLLIFYLFTFVFNKATLKIYPKITNLQIEKEININSTSTKNLGELISLTKSSSKVIEKKDKQKVQSKAFGEIIIYNNFSESPQRLIKNTRFESEDGYIFRIGESIEIPGKKGNIPGSIKVKVTADSFGEEYNIPPSKFTIPGFKGTPRYDGFYAESLSPMKGGSDGEKYIVNKDALEFADSALRGELKKELSKEIFEGIKNNKIIATSSLYFEFSNNLEEYESGKATEYVVTAKAYVYVFDNNLLANYLMSNFSNSYNQNENYKILDINNLNISPKTDFQKNNTLKLEGFVSIINIIDHEKLKLELKNKKESEHIKVLSKFEGIEKSLLKISPIWSNTIPNNINKIKIQEILP